MIRNHVRWTHELAERLRAAGFEIVTEPMLALFAFRPAGADDAAVRDLLQRINDDGRIYLTQTMVDGRLAIRFQAGSVDCAEADVATAFDTIRELA
jgi:Glutamate decarboxylase and related PLP-dependent proteins